MTFDLVQRFSQRSSGFHTVPPRVPVQRLHEVCVCFWFVFHFTTVKIKMIKITTTFSSL